MQFLYIELSMTFYTIYFNLQLLKYLNGKYTNLFLFYILYLTVGNIK